MRLVSIRRLNELIEEYCFALQRLDSIAREHLLRTTRICFFSISSSSTPSHDDSKQWYETESDAEVLIRKVFHQFRSPPWGALETTNGGEFEATRRRALSRKLCTQALLSLYDFRHVDLWYTTMRRIVCHCRRRSVAGMLMALETTSRFQPATTSSPPHNL